MLGVQQIDSYNGLAIPRNLVHSLWPTENVPAPLHTRKGGEGIFQLDSSSDVIAVVEIGVSVGSGILVGIWGAVVKEDGVLPCIGM